MIPFSLIPPGVNDPVGYLDRLRQAVANRDQCGDARGFSLRESGWHDARSPFAAEVSVSVLNHLVCGITPEMLIADSVQKHG
jgi:hypothetical protein